MAKDVKPSRVSQQKGWQILPWVLFALFATGACVLATLNEPVRHWETRIYFAWPLLLAPPVLVPWLIYSLYVIWRRPERRKAQAKRIGYVLAIFAALSMAWVFEQSARGAYAERIIEAVNSYKKQYGRYPETLDQVGFRTRHENGQDRGTELWGIAYANGSIGGLAPAIFYPGPLPFSMNDYEFDKGRWTFSED
jgi:hypothetical protein